MHPNEIFKILKPWSIKWSHIPFNWQYATPGSGYSRQHVLSATDHNLNLIVCRWKHKNFKIRQMDIIMDTDYLLGLQLYRISNMTARWKRLFKITINVKV